MPVFVKASFRKGRAVKAYTRASGVKTLKKTARTFAPTKTVDKLKAKYMAAHRFADKRDFGHGYDFDGFVRRTRARALGKKTSIYG